MVNPQQFGTGVTTGVGSNTMGMMNAQQVLAQQQQQSNALQQIQHLQQQQQQMQLQQQQQQVAMVQQNTQSGNPVSTPQTPVPPSQPPQQKQPGKDINTASLCRFGQETVQEIVSRTQELFQSLKLLQPPNGTLHYYYNFHFTVRLLI